MSIAENLNIINKKLPLGTKLVAVSKYHTLPELMEAYNAGQRLFGENRPQELAEKVPQMPSDVQWHFLGHLQTNKLKLVLPYTCLVHSVDSLHLLQEIQKWGKAENRVADVLLEMHIGVEQTKQGFHEEEALEIMFDASGGKFPNVNICGLMGMASHTDCEEAVRADFKRISDFMSYLQDLFPEMDRFKELSIGMSSDYHIALEYGSTYVRIGTSIFGPRDY